MPDKPPSPDAPSPAPETGRSAKAGREFLQAVGADLSAAGRRLRDQVRQRRAERPPRPVARRLAMRLAGGLALLAAFGIMLVGAVSTFAVYDLPLEGGARLQPAVLVEAADGTPLGRVGTLKVSDAARDDFSPDLVKAVISIEDRRFYHHYGIDLRGIGRALHQNIAAGEVVQGGSTISQQLVKVLVPGGEDRTMERKIHEAATALQLERRLSKDEILTRYLNAVYMGGGTYGMPAAARLYFDKTVAELTLAEAAMLAGMIRSPSLLNPLRDLAAAQRRAAVVIDAMLANGAIDAASAQKAKAEPAVPARESAASGAKTWFANWAAQEAVALAGGAKGALRIRTTLQPELQALAEGAVSAALADKGASRGVSQAAVVAMRPDGAIVAMVGGRDYGESQFNRAVQAMRQPGSAFKLFVYLAALRSGFSPDSVLDASPVDIKGWKPANFGGGNLGRIGFSDAFARSVNTATVRLAMQVGLDKVVATARELGIRSPLSATPSLALGASEVNLLELTSAFAAVMAGAAPIRPWGISAFATDETAPLRGLGAPGGPRRPIGPARDAMVGLLQQVVERGTGRGAAMANIPAAGKTGTSQDYRDAWFIGFTDNLIVGVWVGNDDGTPMEEVTGGSLPAAIWKNFQAKAHDLVAGTTPLPAANGETAVSFAESPAGSCDYQVCAAFYSSFRASDCTYQPYSGPRQVCRRGSGAADTARPAPMPDRTVTTVSAGTAVISERGAAPASCNVAACSAAYSSFRASDCSYQPYDGGPRRVCAKPGSGGAEETRSERRPPAETLQRAEFGPPARSRRDAEEEPESRSAATGFAQGNSCNIGACAAAYSSFNPQDCTYQPPEGGQRKLCRK